MRKSYGKSALFSRNPAEDVPIESFIYIHFPVLCEPSLSATALSQTIFHRVFQLLAQMAHVCFHERKRVHTRLSEKNRTQGHTRRNRWCFGWGWYHYPRSVPHVSETLRGQGVERRTWPLLSLGRGALPKNAESLRDSDALMRVAVPRRRGPAGLRSHAAVVRSVCLAGLKRLDQAFRQSYYHTQRPSGQPFGACVGAALGGKMRAITLDFKESHHGRTLPHKRTDPRVFHGTFSGGAVSGNGGKISAECTSVLAIFGRSARYEGYRYGLEKALSERRKLFSVYHQYTSPAPAAGHLRHALRSAGAGNFGSS